MWRFLLPIARCTVFVLHVCDVCVSFLSLSTDDLLDLPHFAGQYLHKPDSC